jgi:hypothetical protein
LGQKGSERAGDAGVAAGPSTALLTDVSSFAQDDKIKKRRRSFNCGVCDTFAQDDKHEEPMAREWCSHGRRGEAASNMGHPV